jgi:hypothetical protein
VAVWVISISENFHGSKFLQRIFNVSNVDFFPWSVGDCYNYLRAFSFSCSWDGDLRELSKLIEIFVNKKQDACLVVICDPVQHNEKCTPNLRFRDFHTTGKNISSASK